LLIDNGDLLQGTPLMHHFVKYNRSGIHPAIMTLNHLGYNAAVLGNHDFNYGLEILRQAVHDSAFPWLSANIIDSRTRQPAFGQPYLIRQIRQEAKVAILGLTTHFIPQWEIPEFIHGLTFIDALSAAKKWVELIRNVEKPDVMIISYHGGLERDPDTGEAVEALSGENQAYAMCTELEGVDVLLTGHQHQLLTDEVNGVTILQPGCNGLALGKVSIQLVKRKEAWMIAQKTASLILTNETVQPDIQIMKLTERHEQQTQVWLDRPIGEVFDHAPLQDPLSAGLSDHPFMDDMSPDQLDATASGLTRGAVLTSDSPESGSSVTMRDIIFDY
ncbi:metallophosphoesterase, partial [Paenibacillus sepulcri]|nr:metallophosphoesterase [Paenibacillus sepulcri]